MGSITTRRRADGSTVYTAQLRLKRNGSVYHSESATFDKKPLAQAWMRRRETEVDEARARGEPITKGAKSKTVGDLIAWYQTEASRHAKWGRTKTADLKRLGGSAIAKKIAIFLDAANIIEHAQARRDGGAGPATVSNDVIWLRTVLRAARASLNLPIRLSVLDDATQEMRAQRLVAKSRPRDRRLTQTEEDALVKYFSSRDKRSQIPMLDIMQFALLTSRRQEEITTLRWLDLDEKRGIAWLDDVKHPRHKHGNRRSFRVISDAWAVIKRQPKIEGEDRVFPYNPKSVGAAFTRACKSLGLKDLRFHDLRHEATSRLFEKGYSIQEVAQFTLHESWATLRRYTHLRPENVPER